MKKLSILTLVLTAFLLSSNSGCNPDSVAPLADVADDPDVVEISAEENLGLAYMREEEKLARDVYITFYAMYDNKVFNNISKSEQQHMDAVLTLLEKYNIEDPALEDVGLFTNEILQQLYTDLIAQGSESEIDALLVGATIEDLDIKDLADFTLETDDADIIQVYNSLACGSRNHMRAFISQLTNLEVTYTTQFITQEELNSIITADKEKCGQGGN